MNELVIMKDNQAITTSLMISEVFKKEHKNVLKDIENLAAQNLATKNLFHESTYENRGKEYKQYLMERDGFTLLAMGYTGKKALEFKLKYIEAFNKMEESIKNTIQIPNSPMDALKLMISIQEESQVQIKSIDNRVVELEENVSLNPGEYNTVGRKVGERIRLVCTDRRWNLNKEQKSVLYKAINTDITKSAGVRTRSQLKQKDFDMVYDLILGWEPSRATVIEIQRLEGEV